MEYEYWLARMTALSDQKKILLKEYMKSAENVYYIEETRLAKIEFLSPAEKNTIRQAKKEHSLKKSYEEVMKKGICVIPWGTPQYPEKLTRIANPPYALFLKGCLPAEAAFAVAVVGARKCSPYGEKYALEFGEKLARCGIQIISGMARGVDGYSQRGALMAKGQTFAVLGSGVDVCYPRENAGLYRDILEQGGGILSEQPPGSAPLSRYFPMRNRIISGLADVVLVIEARERSGSLITADFALEQGKDVYALPGPVDSPLSQGCNRLLRQGAGVLLDAESLLEDLHLENEKKLLNCTENSDKNEKVLESPENMVYSCLGLYPKSLGQLIEETRCPPDEVLNLLVTLEIQGYIREVSKNYYIKIK